MRKNKYFITMFSRYFLLSLTLLGFLVCSCSTREIESDLYCDVWVAVLPFANYTNDLEIPQNLRNLFIKSLKKKGYNVIPTDTVDARLLRMGITDGGQLPTISNKVLGDTLGVDILGYGKVIQADYITLGVYLEREVELEVSLFWSFNTISLWSSNGRAFTRKIYVAENDNEYEEEEDEEKEDRSVLDRIKGFLGSILRLIGIQLAEKVFVDLFTHPLYYEAALAVDDATRSLPYCGNLYY